MTIWLDAQLPPKLAHWIKFRFGIEAHAVRDIGLLEAKDIEIFQKAQASNAIVMTKDSDFIDLSFRFGAPPKIILLNCGNLTTPYLQEFLQSRFPKALEILKSEDIVEIG